MQDAAKDRAKAEADMRSQTLLGKCGTEVRCRTQPRIAYSNGRLERVKVRMF